MVVSYILVLNPIPLHNLALNAFLSYNFGSRSGTGESFRIDER